MLESLTKRQQGLLKFYCTQLRTKYSQQYLYEPLEAFKDSLLIELSNIVSSVIGIRRASKIASIVDCSLSPSGKLIVTVGGVRY